MVETIATDVLVIGGGAAAARAAVEAARAGAKVAMVDKGEFGHSGSSPASLGGFACSLNPEDRPELFMEDWVRCGGKINDQNLVWEAVTKSVPNVIELENLGMEFLKDERGDRLLYRGAGQSLARGLTAKYHGAEGRNIMTVLVEEVRERGVQVNEGIMITKLLQNKGAVVGAIGLSQKLDFYAFSARAVILAAGGANRLYPNTASPIVDPKYRTTGDAFCLAFDAGASLIDIEFAQFRDSPPGGARFGGRYLNAKGERFMERYDPLALEKAPRHKMVEALYRELQEGRGPIYWEVGGIKETELGLSLARQYFGQERVEIVIDFQRLLGGVRINERTETSIPGLYAAGESSGGLHGADRMQGNAFLETQVFGANAGRHAAEFALNREGVKIDLGQVEEESARIKRFKGGGDPAEVRETVSRTMWQQVGVIREAQGLRRAVADFAELKRAKIPQLLGKDIFSTLEAANLLLTAEMVARAALTREETRGTHIRSDYAFTDDARWLKHVCINNKDGEVAISTVPVLGRS